ncbi:hypothetical protein D3C72_1087270 [compost metagenome]
MHRLTGLFPRGDHQMVNQWHHHKTTAKTEHDGRHTGNNAGQQHENNIHHSRRRS